MNGGDGGSGSTSKIIDLEEEEIIQKKNQKNKTDHENINRRLINLIVYFIHY